MRTQRVAQAASDGAGTGAPLILSTQAASCVLLCMTGDKTITAEGALRAMDPGLAKRLEPFADSPDGALGLMIAMLPLGDRVWLEAYGLTRTAPPAGAGAEAVAELGAQVAITAAGRAVLRTLASSREVPSDAELDRRAQRVLARLMR